MSSPYPPPGNQGQHGYPPQGGAYGQPQQNYGVPSPYAQSPASGYGAQGPAYGAQSYGAGGAQGQYGQGQYGQYGAPAPQQHAQVQGYGQPPQGQDQLRQWFNSVDLDRSGAISQNELKSALVNGDWTPFSDNTIKTLMNMFDQDRSGTIGFNEFAGLWQYIKDWQGIFRQYDRDRSGTIDSRELGAALQQFGFSLPPNILQSLERKYSQQPGRGITFDAFVQVCVTVRSLTESFKRADVQGTGYAQLSYIQFLEIVIAAP